MLVRAQYARSMTRFIRRRQLRAIDSRRTVRRAAYLQRAAEMRANIRAPLFWHGRFFALAVIAGISMAPVMLDWRPRHWGPLRLKWWLALLLSLLLTGRWRALEIRQGACLCGAVGAVGGHNLI